MLIVNTAKIMSESMIGFINGVNCGLIFCTDKEIAHITNRAEEAVERYNEGIEHDWLNDEDKELILGICEYYVDRLNEKIHQKAKKLDLVILDKVMYKLEDDGTKKKLVLRTVL
jgi:tetrahydromethanopterin S-methyltransferase subunit A